MLRRHDLLRPGPAAWEAMLGGRPGLQSVPLMADWARLGRPVIVRRRMLGEGSAGEGAAGVPAAVPLPPSHGKQRIAVSFPPAAALVALPPVRLRDAAPAAPSDWQRVIALLVAVGERVGVEPTVFGSLLWQHLTGLPYLSARSDLDLLWCAADEAAVEALTVALAGLDAAGPIRLDGELALPDGAGVNWREFAQADRAATVLVKTMDGVEARSRAALFDTSMAA